MCPQVFTQTSLVSLTTWITSALKVIIAPVQQATRLQRFVRKELSEGLYKQLKRATALLAPLATGVPNRVCSRCVVQKAITVQSPQRSHVLALLALSDLERDWPMWRTARLATVVVSARNMDSKRLMESAILATTASTSQWLLCQEHCTLVASETYVKQVATVSRPLSILYLVNLVTISKTRVRHLSTTVNCASAECSVTVDLIQQEQTLSQH